MPGHVTTPPGPATLRGRGFSNRLRGNGLVKHASGRPSDRHAIPSLSWWTTTHHHRGGPPHPSPSAARRLDPTGRRRLPQLSRPQATVLALYSFGMSLARRCGLNSVVTALVPLLGQGFHTLRSRLQEVYQPAQAKSGGRRAALDVSACFAPLLAWVLEGWKSPRLALALDATSLGDRFTVLSIAVVYRGEAIPVAWKVLPANVPHPWEPEWRALVRAFAGLIPAGYTVIAMTDRGLYARWLYREIQAPGWHPLMRITKLSK